MSGELRARLEDLVGGFEPGEEFVALLYSLEREAPKEDIAIQEPELEHLVMRLARGRLPMLFTDRRVIVFEVDPDDRPSGIVAQIPSTVVRVARIKKRTRFTKASVVLRIGSVDLQLDLGSDEHENLDLLARSQYVFSNN